MTTDSTPSPAAAKVKRGKKAAKFPLTVHKGTGYWKRKVHGKLHYFFRVSEDPTGEKSLKEWMRVRDDLLEGREPPPLDENSITVEALCFAFLEFKESLLDSDELTQRTFDYYKAICKVAAEFFGRAKSVDSLRPKDFQRLRGHMAKKWGPVRLGNAIGVVRSVFNYGDKNDLLKAKVKFGSGFEKPSAKTLRKKRTEKGARMFEREQLLAILEECTPNGKAMTLLGINGGIGNSDIALLPLKAVDLTNGWIDYPRNKTGVPRRIPLWPETVAAIKEAKAQRGKPNNEEDAGLLFIGRRGESYKKGMTGYRVNQELARALKRVKIEGRSFYDLRRTFQTISEGAHDLAATQAIMGHAPSSGDMSAIYRQRIEDERLEAVTDYVRNWLFGETSKDEDEQAPAMSEESKKEEAKPANSETKETAPAIRLYVG